VFLYEIHNIRLISQPNRNLSRYPFRPFLVYTYPSCGQKLSSKVFEHVKRCPHKIQLNPDQYFLDYLEVFNVIYVALTIKLTDDTYFDMGSSVADS